MIPLLRKVKSLGLDLFHDVVTVQADVTANFIWAGGRIRAVIIVVYDKKPRDRLINSSALLGSSPPHQCKSQGPSFDPIHAHSAIIAPYQTAMNGRESSEQ